MEKIRKEMIANLEFKSLKTTKQLQDASRQLSSILSTFTPEDLKKDKKIQQKYYEIKTEFKKLREQVKTQRRKEKSNQILDEIKKEIKNRLRSTKMSYFKLPEKIKAVDTMHLDQKGKKEKKEYLQSIMDEKEKIMPELENLNPKYLFIKILNEHTNRIEASLYPNSTKKKKTPNYNASEKSISENKKISSMMEEAINNILENENEDFEKNMLKQKNNEEKKKKNEERKKLQEEKKNGKYNDGGDEGGPASSLFIGSMKDYDGDTKLTITKKRKQSDKDVNKQDLELENGKRLHVSWRISQRNKEKEKSAKWGGKRVKFEDSTN